MLRTETEMLRERSRPDQAKDQTFSVHSFALPRGILRQLTVSNTSRELSDMVSAAADKGGHATSFVSILVISEV